MLARVKEENLHRFLFLRIETLGIRHGLTAVEALYLLDFPPTKIVTEILYSLLKKRAVWIFLLRSFSNDIFGMDETEKLAAVD